MGPKVTKVALHTLNRGQFPFAPNHTFITLIPKKNQPSSIEEYLPSSLCNVLYKLIFIVIANRLKCVLPSVITESQNIFVPEK